MRYRTRIAAFLTTVALVTSLIAFTSPSNRVALADPGTPPGTASGPIGTIDPPLSSFTSLTLPTVAGDIRAVVYDGNALLIGASSTVTMTGFGSVPPAAVANTTYVVADGQCGISQAEPCTAVPPAGGSGDTLSFTGGAGTLTRGPDAFRGHDHCSYAPAGDPCLWDTRTENVSAQVATGDTSVTAVVTSGPSTDGTDCLNHEAQVFAVGPAAAWAFGGYQAAGAGLRNQGSGTIAIAGIPPTATVVKAFLYWNILNSSRPSNAMTLNMTSTPGTFIGSDGDPCWGAGTSWAFRADVTSVVAPTGNGAYTVSGYPTGSTSGLNPFVVGSTSPMAEGASLIVFYGQVSTPGKVTGGGYIDPVTGELVGDASMLIKSGSMVGNTANFGFVMSFKAGDTSPTGNLLFNDKAFPERVKSTSIDLLVIADGACGTNTHFDARITADENGTPGQTFHVFGDDCDEPGSSPGSGPDMFGIEKVPVGYTAAGPLIGGNIQIHKS